MKKLPPYLFWVTSLEKTVWQPFWWLILFVFILTIPFLRPWWWFFLPLMLVSQLKKLYLWYMNWDFFYAGRKWVMLELIPPKEILKPFKAMEDVFAAVWPIWDHPNFREKWCEGELENGPFWLSWEIASIEGKIHFFVRCLEDHVKMVKNALYAHYPEVEIYETEDYTKLVPKTIPNEEWDFYGEDFILYKGNHNPIKTYEKFFEPQGERITEEEKRIDPLLGLLESLTGLGPGEYYWIQFITTPINDLDEPEWRKEGQKEVDKIAKRPQKKEMTFFEELFYVFQQIITGPQKEGSGASAKYKWIETAKSEGGEREMLLTPAEREQISQIENKLSKPVYRVTIRGAYVARRECWNASHRSLLRAYMPHFTSPYNFMGFYPPTRPKVHFFMRARGVFFRARKMFKNSVSRLPPLFPYRTSEYANSIYSIEELATLFHFPLRTTGMIVPALKKVESKKGVPPPNLPIG